MISAVFIVIVLFWCFSDLDEHRVLFRERVLWMMIKVSSREEFGQREIDLE